MFTVFDFFSCARFFPFNLLLSVGGFSSSSSRYIFFWLYLFLFISLLLSLFSFDSLISPNSSILIALHRAISTKILINLLCRYLTLENPSCAQTTVCHNSNFFLLHLHLLLLLLQHLMMLLHPLHS